MNHANHVSAATTPTATFASLLDKDDEMRDGIWGLILAIVILLLVVVIL